MDSLLTAARIDVARSAANLLFAAAQPMAGQASRLLGAGEPIEKRSGKTENPATPAAGAFAIWGPIFAGSLNYALRTIARRDQPLVRQVGWLSAAAFAGDTAWELWAQFQGIGRSSVAIIAATATTANAAMLLAARSSEAEPSRALVLNSMAPLAGWLTVATAANLAGARIAEGGAADPETSSRVAVRLVAGASLSASVLAYASHGDVFYAAAAGWGLAGVATRNVRDGNRPVAIVALLGLAAVAGATLVARGRG